MARLLLSFIFIGVLHIHGALYLNYEEDLRAGYYFHSDKVFGEINSIGGSVRQVFSGKKGDRLILYLQGEAEHNFSEIMAHQLYARFKGPMGKWNISLGRIQLPWGLLTNWSMERMPYRSSYSIYGTMKADNGVLLNGTIGLFDYGISLTQGYGMMTPESFPGPGLLTARAAISPLLGGELTVGVSGSFGTSHRGHGDDEVMEVEHQSALIDLTAYILQATLRMEGGAEYKHDEWHPLIFAALDYQVLPKLTIMGSGNIFTHEDHWQGTLYLGAETKLKSVTIRGGYEYEKTNPAKHTVKFQLYRQLSFNR